MFPHSCTNNTRLQVNNITNDKEGFGGFFNQLNHNPRVHVCFQVEPMITPACVFKTKITENNEPVVKCC